MVGTTTVAAGQYAITSQIGSPVVRLEGSKSYSVLSNPAGSVPGSQEAKLVFHRYGDQYFLSRIATASAGRDFAMSRTEREVKKTASAAGQHETEVLVAMR